MALKNQFVFMNNVNTPKNPAMQIIQNHLSFMGFLTKKSIGGSNENKTKKMMERRVYGFIEIWARNRFTTPRP
jgi:hypothetical protein